MKINKRNVTQLLILFLSINLFANKPAQEIRIKGELKKWHKITLELEGPLISENDFPNPFLNYKLEATFTNGAKAYTIPGYFAADGNAAETSATAGNIWKVHFCPDETGKWNYEISFQTGKNIAVSDDARDIKSTSLHGKKGTFTIEETDKTGDDFRGRGRLKYNGTRYLQFAETGEYFLKGGADSPENFLGYIDFDNTYYGGNREHRKGESAPNLGLHAYEPHVGDWQEGDPQWQNGKGKGMIGALNYLASEEMNSVYFLTMNILGDGDDVWPYIDRNERYRFDCSKLDQWEIVFSHMDKLGLMLHVVLQETENETVLDAGYLDVQRKLYLRELVARFSHHLAITWNLGEEHFAVEWSPYGQTIEDTKKMASYLRAIDPYNSFIVVHTHSYEPHLSEYMNALLGFEYIEGPSVQVANANMSHEQTKKWINLSADSLHQWVVCLDEIGRADSGAIPDAVDPDHDRIRHQTLWGNLMAGGAGVEWYFGYKFAHNDLNAEDWRSRDILWDQTRHALTFFHEHLPFWEMQNADELVDNGYCFAKQDEVYVIYKPMNKSTSIDLSHTTGEFEVRWFNPKYGGELQISTKKKISAGSVVSPGLPPENPEADWVCLLKKKM